LNGIDSTGLQTESSGSTPLEEAAGMSSAELHTQAGPPEAPRAPPEKQPYTPKFKLVGSEASGDLRAEGEVPIVDLSQARTPAPEAKPETLEPTPCFSDHTRAVGLPVGSCAGPAVVAETYFGARFPAAGAFLLMAQAKDDRDPHLVAGAMSFAVSLPSAPVEDPSVLTPTFANRSKDAELLEAAEKITPKAGRFDVVVHGTADDFWVRTGADAEADWAIRSPERLKQFMRQSGYTGGPVRLISCETGSCPGGAAQKLANVLNEPVLAPTQKVFIWPDGRLTVGPNRYTNSGKWEWFRPQK
jgi:hypothetical protein